MTDRRPRVDGYSDRKGRKLGIVRDSAEWGHFGHVQIGRARRPLMAFV
jgi:hypothetical protein